MSDLVSIELYDQEKAFQEELAKIQDGGIKEKLNKMKSFVLQRIALERQFRVEQAKLESKYEELYRPMYDKRSDIINGKTTYATLMGLETAQSICEQLLESALKKLTSLDLRNEHLSEIAQTFVHRTK